MLIGNYCMLYKFMPSTYIKSLWISEIQNTSNLYPSVLEVGS